MHKNGEESLKYDKAVNTGTKEMENSPSLTKSIAELQLLDYICGELTKVPKRLAQIDKKKLYDPYAGSKEEAAAKQRKEKARQKTEEMNAKANKKRICLRFR